MAPKIFLRSFGPIIDIVTVCVGSGLLTAAGAAGTGLAAFGVGTGAV